MAATGPKGGTFCEINITPLTDVFLVLLVVVIIAAPSMQSLNKDLVAPKLAQGDVLNKDWLMIEVAADGQFKYDSTILPTEEEDLRRSIESLLVARGDKYVVVRGDASAQSERILWLLQMAVRAGATRTYIAGELEHRAAPAVSTAGAPAP